MLTLRIEKQLQGPQGSFPLSIQELVPTGSFLALYGPSGSGKTTLLRIIAGLTRPEAGTIRWQQQVWFDKNRRLHRPPQERALSFAFQSPTLFPNMTVAQNLQFALPPGGNRDLLSALIEVCDLGKLLTHRPQLLSGGQAQRVALARAILREAPLLLLDEPFNALNEELKRRIQGFLLSIHREKGWTTLLVTHRLADVFRLADKVWVMDQGQIQQKGVPEEVFTEKNPPNNPRIIGEILHVNAFVTPATLTVLVGDQLLHIEVSTTEITHWAEGDRVSINWSAQGGPKLQRA